jgi:hypothetical protein
MSKKDTDHGRPRLVCTQRREAGTCDHRRVYISMRSSAWSWAGFAPSLAHERRSRYLPPIADLRLGPMSSLILKRASPVSPLWPEKRKVVMDVTA